MEPLLSPDYVSFLDSLVTFLLAFLSSITVWFAVFRSLAAFHRDTRRRDSLIVESSSIEVPLHRIFRNCIRMSISWRQIGDGRIIAEELRSFGSEWKRRASDAGCVVTCIETGTAMIGSRYELLLYWIRVLNCCWDVHVRCQVDRVRYRDGISILDHYGIASFFVHLDVAVFIPFFPWNLLKKIELNTKVLRCSYNRSPDWLTRVLLAGTAGGW